MTEPEDLEDALAVEYWSVNKIVLVDEDGASELVHLLLKDNDTDKIQSVVLHPENASWMAWAILGVSQGFIGALGLLEEEDDDQSG